MKALIDADFFLYRAADLLRQPAPQAQQGVTVEELACIMREMPDTCYRGEAAWLLTHPRIGHLLSGGTRMIVGDVVVFEADKWHAWISHGLCALAGICVQRITPPTTEEN